MLPTDNFNVTTLTFGRRAPVPLVCLVTWLCLLTGILCFAGMCVKTLYGDSHAKHSRRVPVRVSSLPIGRCAANDRNLQLQALPASNRYCVFNPRRGTQRRTRHGGSTAGHISRHRRERPARVAQILFQVRVSNILRTRRNADDGLAQGRDIGRYIVAPTRNQYLV